MLGPISHAGSRSPPARVEQGRARIARPRLTTISAAAQSDGPENRRPIFAFRATPLLHLMRTQKYECLRKLGAGRVHQCGAGDPPPPLPEQGEAVSHGSDGASPSPALTRLPAPLRGQRPRTRVTCGQDGEGLNGGVTTQPSEPCPLCG